MLGSKNFTKDLWKQKWGVYLHPQQSNGLVVQLVTPSTRGCLSLGSKVL